jgi:hypothetical protein
VTWADRPRKEGELKGKAVGRAEGKADALLRILRRRRLHLSERQVRRIAKCRDIGRLNRWMDAAMDAQSATEVLRSAMRH